MKVRRLIFLTHRWMGLATSGVLAIVGVTGALLLLPDRGPLAGLLGPLHERLGAGRPGGWIVVAATGLSLLLQFGGAVLWWKRRQLLVRTRLGWPRAVDDLHHALGAVVLPLTLVLAFTGFLMRFVGPDQPEFRRWLMDFHTARAFGPPIKLLYAIATLALSVQGLTGVLMWWKPWSTTRTPGVRARPTGRAGPSDGAPRPAPTDAQVS